MKLLKVISRASILCLLLSLFFPLIAQAQDQPVIKLSVDKEIGDVIRLGIKGAPDVQIKGVKEDFQGGLGWFDHKYYTLTAKEVKIVGRVEELDCSDNDITELEIAQNPHLEILVCQDNMLQTIDFSKSAVLRDLIARGNVFSTLDLRPLKNLNALALSFNKLSGIDLSENANLYDLHLSGNNLKNLDLSKNKRLAYLTCENNVQLTWIEIAPDNKLLNLNINGNKLSPHAMGYLVKRLQTVPETAKEKDGKLVVVDSKNPKEIQKLSRATVAMAVAKGWKVLDRNAENPQPYEGVDINIEVKLPEVDHARLSVKGNPNLKAVPFGTELELVVEPEVDYRVVEVKVDGVALKAPYKFVVTKEPEIVVVVKHKTSVSDVAATAFTLHPNPAVSYVELSGVEAGATVQLLDLSGRLVLERKLSADARVDVSTLAKSIYLLKVGKHVSKLSIR